MVIKLLPTLPKCSLAKKVALHRKQYKAGKAISPSSRTFSASYLAEWNKQCVDERAGILAHVAD